MDYQELKEKSERTQDKQATRAKENYHYARSKGFSARESTFLQYKTKEEIDEVAKDRDAGNGA